MLETVVIINVKYSSYWQPMVFLPNQLFSTNWRNKATNFLYNSQKSQRVRNQTEFHIIVIAHPWRCRGQLQAEFHIIWEKRKDRSTPVITKFWTWAGQRSSKAHTWSWKTCSLWTLDQFYMRKSTIFEARNCFHSIITAGRTRMKTMIRVINTDWHQVADWIWFSVQ